MIYEILLYDCDVLCIMSFLRHIDTHYKSSVLKFPCPGIHDHVFVLLNSSSSAFTFAKCLTHFRSMKSSSMILTSCVLIRFKSTLTRTTHPPFRNSEWCNIMVPQSLKVWKFESLKVCNLKMSIGELWTFESLKHLKICKFESLKFWKFESLNIWKFKSLKVWKF